MIEFEETASPLSVLDIKRIERRLGVRLPHDLNEHYLMHNGGRPNPRFFVKDGEAYEVARFFPMNPGTQETSFEQVYVMMVDQTPEFPRGYIPFAHDPTGDLFIYSMRPESFGHIMLNSHEDYGDEDRYVVFLAPNLSEFLESLTEEPET